MGERQDTDEFLAVRFPHLSKSWLDEINEMVGVLKQYFSGNAQMHVPWSGGLPQQTEWLVKGLKKPAKKKF